MLSTVIGGLTLAVVTGLAGYLGRQLHDIRKEYSAVISAQRSQLKASIVRSYEEAVARGYITAMELDTLNKRADNYALLHGDTYIETIRAHANTLDIHGSIPEYTHPENHNG